MRNFMSSFDRRVKELAMIAVAFAAAFMVMLVAEGTFVKSVEASPLCSVQPIIAYNIDYEMDSATAEQPIEY